MLDLDEESGINEARQTAEYDQRPIIEQDIARNYLTAKTMASVALP